MKIESDNSAKWKIAAVLSLLIVGLICSSAIDTFNRSEFIVWPYLVLPLLILFNYLTIREWKATKIKRPAKEIRQIFFLANMIGLILSIPLLGYVEFINISWDKEKVEDDAVLVCKWISGGKTWTRIAKFTSQRDHGMYTVEVSSKEYEQLKPNSIYKLKYNIGMFGWSYKVGSLQFKTIGKLNGEACR